MVITSHKSFDHDLSTLTNLQNIFSIVFVRTEDSEQNAEATEGEW